MRKTSMLAVVKGGEEGCKNHLCMLLFIPIMPCLQQLQSVIKGRGWENGLGDKVKWLGG